MPLEPFDDNTFVAFTDISGFKEMMKSDKRAVHAMDRFYNAGFNALRREQNVNGLFISDCGILFTRNGSKQEQLESLLRVLKELNCALLTDKIMLTSSVAWGHFSYHERIEFNGIDKQPVYGNGYLSAFLDNEGGAPKIQPGQCRIVKRNLNGLPNVSQANFFEETATHHYYYWNVETPDQIARFKERYKDSYSLKYSGMLSALCNE